MITEAHLPSKRSSVLSVVKVNMSRALIHTLQDAPSLQLNVPGTGVAYPFIRFPTISLLII